MTDPAAASGGVAGSRGETLEPVSETARRLAEFDRKHPKEAAARRLAERIAKVRDSPWSAVFPGIIVGEGLLNTGRFIHKVASGVLADDEERKAREAVALAYRRTRPASEPYPDGIDDTR